MPRAVLSNGLTVVGRESLGSPTVAINAFLRLSVLDERPDTVGIRQLTQMWLADRPATAERPSLAEQLDAIGARFDVSTEADFVKVSLLAAADDFPTAFQLLRRALYDEQFAPESFEARRRFCLRLIAARAELLPTRADDEVRTALYPNSERGWSPLGDARAVAKLTPQQVTEFHRTHYLPGLTVISVAGGIPWGEVTSQASRIFGSVLPGPPTSPITPAQTEARAGTVLVDMNTDEAAVMVGGRAPNVSDPDYPAAALAISILGAGMDSRLYHALREKESLAYSVQAELTPSLVAGRAEAYALCDVASAQHVASVIKSEISRLAQNPPDAAELDRRKRYLRGTYLLNRQRNSDCAHYLGLLEVLVPGQGLKLEDDLQARIMAVSGPDVSRAAQQLFQQPVVVILKPNSENHPDSQGSDGAAAAPKPTVG